MATIELYKSKINNMSNYINHAEVCCRRLLRGFVCPKIESSRNQQQCMR